MKLLRNTTLSLLLLGIAACSTTKIGEVSKTSDNIPEEKINELVKKHFVLTPKWIIERLDLLRPIYKKTASYGHFGRDDPDFTWEKTDMADVLRKDAGLEKTNGEKVVEKEIPV